MSPTVLPTAPRQQQGLRGRHVLAGFLGFFAIVFVVNGAMMYAAVSTYSGLVANEPYRKGLHYNERLAAAERACTHHAYPSERHACMQERLVESQVIPVANQ